MQNTEPFFISDAGYNTLENRVLELVHSFYKEISSLICSYIHCRLQLSQLLDVYDDSNVWIIGCVVALRTNYVGIHYNGYSCNYDDWIHYVSLRLAPLHTYSSYDYSSDYAIFSEEYKLGQTVYNQFLSSIDDGYRDRLTTLQLSQYISACIECNYDPSQSAEHNLIEIVCALGIYNQYRHRNYHVQLFNAEFQRNPNTYKRRRSVMMSRITLEKKARLYREAVLAKTQPM